MGILRPETMKLIAREIYDYDLPDDRAATIAQGAGALLTTSYHLGAMLKLESIDPSFSYPFLEAEAARIRGGKV